MISGFDFGCIQSKKRQNCRSIVRLSPPRVSVPLPSNSKNKRHSTGSNTCPQYLPFAENIWRAPHFKQHFLIIIFFFYLSFRLSYSACLLCTFGFVIEKYLWLHTIGSHVEHLIALRLVERGKCVCRNSATQFLTSSMRTIQFSYCYTSWANRIVSLTLWPYE